MLTNNLGLSLEYAYTGYGQIDSLMITGDFLGVGTFTDEVKLNLMSNTMLAQLSYHF
jgi:hypothetical protein